MARTASSSQGKLTRNPHAVRADRLEELARIEHRTVPQGLGATTPHASLETGLRLGREVTYPSPPGKKHWDHVPEAPDLQRPRVPLHQRFHGPGEGPPFCAPRPLTKRNHLAAAAVARFGTRAAPSRGIDALTLDRRIKVREPGTFRTEAKLAMQPLRNAI